MVSSYALLHALISRSPDLECSTQRFLPRLARRGGGGHGRPQLRHDCFCLSGYCCSPVAPAITGWFGLASRPSRRLLLPATPLTAAGTLERANVVGP
ncbi:hypothetical protein CHLRE_13g563326v5 [Chlamydomonas reinhardtii]|uniref:Uncharacterized protein n=1 Tax=Chlamydomonas reinhardtii TaxID=3055 RepID=A0A2K3CZ38_CHLRE|nr:uncharacterized protein CHLRE_13g563326v5 [Chlamydomonas reinhardtii]PNW73542.1 hypothetical protein CHLRE_13g563326v5 [Chlamydomonas reinhardtii]